MVTLKEYVAEKLAEINSIQTDASALIGEDMTMSKRDKGWLGLGMALAMTLTLTELMVEEGVMTEEEAQALASNLTGGSSPTGTQASASVH